VSLRFHTPDITRSVCVMQHLMLIDENGRSVYLTNMPNLASRIKDRVSTLELTQVEAARRSGISTQRFGNYWQGTRIPDIYTLKNIAKALETTTDWLLGVQSSVTTALSPVLLRLLELDGIPQPRAEAIAATVFEALKLLAALPDEGDAALRTQMAAQLAWQMRVGSTRTQ
jgi:transcriptional regulator with XRE-family HTH domain